MERPVAQEVREWQEGQVLEEQEQHAALSGRGAQSLLRPTRVREGTVGAYRESSAPGKLRGDCIFEDPDTKQRLTHFGTLTPDHRSCTDGRDTVPVGQYVGYDPELRQIDLGQQGPHRRGVLAGYKEPTTAERLNTALGRGIERGQEQNQKNAEEDKAAAAAADAKIGSALKSAAEMTPTSLLNGLEAATEEAEEGIKHAAADPKGTFNRALDRFKEGVEATAGAIKDGINGTVQAVNQGVDSAIDWSKKDPIDQAEDALKLGREKATTAPDRECWDDHGCGWGNQAGGRGGAGWRAGWQKGEAASQCHQKRGGSQAPS